MEMYSPRKNYNFSNIKNELKSGRKQITIITESENVIVPENEVERRNNSLAFMRRKLKERIRIFFEDEEKALT